MLVSKLACDTQTGHGRNVQLGDCSCTAPHQCDHLQYIGHMTHQCEMQVTGHRESAEAQLAELESQLKDIHALNAKMEEDLLAAERSNRMFRSGSDSGAHGEAVAATAQQGQWSPPTALCLPQR